MPTDAVPTDKPAAEISANTGTSYEAAPKSLRRPEAIVPVPLLHSLHRRQPSPLLDQLCRVCRNAFDYIVSAFHRRVYLHIGRRRFGDVRSLDYNASVYTYFDAFQRRSTIEAHYVVEVEPPCRL
ncbi:hypothetical protein AAVH_22816 [Aphelenchoides avenae]|nr:hypothetical protein AAVH_22816 [Aphelenchus avenae]